MKPILSVKNLGINFGGLRAVSGFNLDVYPNELVGLIGPNGAGKTTVFNMLSGLYVPSDGTIELCGEQIQGKDCESIVSKGIARTFQNIRLFTDQSVADNVKIALGSHYPYSFMDAVLRNKKYQQQEEKLEMESYLLLEIMHLADVKDVKAKNLPYGKQRQLEIARALATHPKLLLLDEPAAGMNPNETKELMEVIRQVRQQFGLAILLIEHDMKLVMEICEKITVLNYGMILTSGSAAQVQSNPEVIKAYLGD